MNRPLVCFNAQLYPLAVKTNPFGRVTLSVLGSDQHFHAQWRLKRGSRLGVVP